MRHTISRVKTLPPQHQVVAAPLAIGEATVKIVIGGRSVGVPKEAVVKVIGGDYAVSAIAAEKAVQAHDRVTKSAASKTENRFDWRFK